MWIYELFIELVKQHDFNEETIKKYICFNAEFTCESANDLLLAVSFFSAKKQLAVNKYIQELNIPTLLTKERAFIEYTKLVCHSATLLLARNNTNKAVLFIMLKLVTIYIDLIAEYYNGEEFKEIKDMGVMKQPITLYHVIKYAKAFEEKYKKVISLDFTGATEEKYRLYYKLFTREINELKRANSNVDREINNNAAAVPLKQFSPLLILANLCFIIKHAFESQYAELEENLTKIKIFSPKKVWNITRIADVEYDTEIETCINKFRECIDSKNDFNVKAYDDLEKCSLLLHSHLWAGIVANRASYKPPQSGIFEKLVSVITSDFHKVGSRPNSSDDEEGILKFRFNQYLPSSDFFNKYAYYPGCNSNNNAEDKKVAYFKFYNAAKKADGLSVATPCLFAKYTIQRFHSLEEFNNDTLNNLNQEFNFFVKLARKGKKYYDAFLIILPPKFGQNIETLSWTTNKILRELSRLDPKNNRCLSNEEAIEEESWQFRYRRTTLFVVTFANCYPSSHSRYVYGLNVTIILFQPLEAFDNHSIPKSKQDDDMRDKVRKSFTSAGMRYHLFNVMQRPVDAYRYVKPIESDHNGIKWWKSADAMPSETSTDSSINNNNSNVETTQNNKLLAMPGSLESSLFSCRIS